MRSGEIWSVFLSVSKGADGNNYLYDLNTKKEGERVSKFTAKPLLDKKISQNESDVNSKYYDDRDSEGNHSFADSLVIEQLESLINTGDSS